jgi:hypothetical protein
LNTWFAWVNTIANCYKTNPGPVGGLLAWLWQTDLSAVDLEVPGTPRLGISVHNVAMDLGAVEIFFIVVVVALVGYVV